MDLNTLEILLVNTGVPRAKTRAYTRIIAHWISRVRNSEPYSTGNPKDIQSLKRIADLGLLDLKWQGTEAVATLSEKGRQMDKVFFQSGYYIKG